MATKKVTKVTAAPRVTPTTAAAAVPALAPKKAAAKKKAVAATPKKAAPKKAKPVALPVATPADLTKLHDEIRMEAYSYFIERSYRPSDPVADWHRAEDTILRRHGLR